VDFERVKQTASDSARKARGKVGAWLGDKGTGGAGRPPGGSSGPYGGGPTGAAGGGDPGRPTRPGYGTGPEDARRRLRAWLATRPDIAYDPRQLDRPDGARTTLWRPGVIQLADTADHASRVTQALRQHAHVTIRSRCQNELDGAPSDAERGRRLALLKKMHKSWPFFSTLLSNMDMVLAKTDLAVASRYAALVSDKKLRKHVFERIVAEWERTSKVLSEITGKSERLAENPLLARSIKNRFPYLDPLNHLQVELLKRHRSGDTNARVRRGIHLTINGIAAGLRNTG